MSTIDILARYYSTIDMAVSIYDRYRYRYNIIDTVLYSIILHSIMEEHQKPQKYKTDLSEPLCKKEQGKDEKKESVDHL